MAILIAGGILLGMILSQFLKWYALFPVCVFAFVLAFADPAHMNGFLGWFIQFVALTTSLQIGYVIGLLTGYVRQAPARSRNPSVHDLDATASSDAEIRKNGRRAA
ncbi:hypothetical protein QEV83_16275 [Methylocapsa sp. D3K7]|uniref:hypothetical protein n=1 Tax=Methylocapsa sp. D3K7 TaxID=3041435 RepID=UPI00244EA9B8|nr:hypothetical protein [Methylocapsa sp. D3K7]WGJ14186.1 hypothetical protein QEV83_16275 [Methylocapsa sp. D3K7]